MTISHPRIAAAVIAGQWAILPESLESIIAIIERTNDDPQLVSTQMGRPLQNTRNVTMRDGVAVIPVTGPIFRYANMFTEISGATSVQDLATDYATALNDPKVKAILLDMDSPGGEAKGVSEFADMVFNSRGVKPVVAYVGGMAASAAYWIASAADEMVMNDTASVGSIGVVTTVRKNQQTDTIEIVSTQSPFKRVDAGTDEGKAKIQNYVDSLAEVFVSAVARNRGVSEETVLKDFGQGDILVGKKAVNAGMADRIGSLEGVIAEMSTNSGKKSTDSRNTTMQSTNGVKIAMDKETLLKEHPELAAALINEGVEKGKAEGLKEGAAAELQRIKDVEASGLPGHEALISELKFDGKTTGGEASQKVLTAEKQNRANVLANIKEDAPPALSQPATSPITEKQGSQADMSTEEKAAADWEGNATLREDFLDDKEAYLAYTKANAKGLIKVLERPEH
jgi:signal peptide peptidase SppA